MRDLYTSEQYENVGSTAFLNAYCNYPLLVGQQTNLYKCVLENTMDLASEERGFIGLLTPESIYDDPKGQPLRRELYKRLRYHSSIKMNFGFLPKFITIRCMVINFSALAEVHHRASLRSAICSILIP